jgi:electron transport complex protein RnfD
MSNLLVSASPHIRVKESVASIMWTVAVALVPPGVFGIFLYGINALMLICISVGSAVATEFLIQKACGGKSTIGDGSAVITGLLLAYIISPGAPWYVPLVGSVFAIGVAKFAFGGLGMNIWNPALAGRAFILSGYIIAMTGSWIYPNERQIIGELRRSGVVLKKPGIVWKKIDATTTATPRSAIKNEITAAQDPDWEGWADLKAGGDKPADWLRRIRERNKTSYIDLLIGTRGGCIGERSTLVLLLGGIFLLLRGIIRWQIPVFYIGTTALLCWALPVKFPGGTAWFAGDPLFAAMSGGLMLGAFFMATDLVTTPVAHKGMIIFAVGCGLITALIRRYGGYPEGVNYSILLMNTAVPLIDRYTRPRKYGFVR